MSHSFTTGSDSESKSSVSGDELVPKAPGGNYGKPLLLSEDEEDTKRVVRSAKDKSDNEPHGSRGDNTVSWELPVHFAVGLVASWRDDSTPYLNFTSGCPTTKGLQHRYRLETHLPPPHGAPPLNLMAFVLLPHTLPHNLTVLNPQVRMEPGGPCIAMGQEEVEEDAVGQELSRSIAQSCSTSRLRPFRCPSVPLPRTADVILSAQLCPSPTKEGPAYLRFCSALWLAPPAFLRAQSFTEVELDPCPVSVWVWVLVSFVISIIIIVLIICIANRGFFRRNRQEQLDLEMGEGQGEGGEGDAQNPSPAL